MQPEFRAAQQPLAPTFAPKTVHRNCACVKIYRRVDHSDYEELTLSRRTDSKVADDTSETFFFPFIFFVILIT